VDENMRRAIRTISSTARTPMTALAMRQAIGSCAPPMRRMPMAIIHLPTGGWTTYSASSVLYELTSPASNAGLGSSGHAASKPRLASDQPSLT
jgi:hypothetical protein